MLQMQIQRTCCFAIQLLRLLPVSAIAIHTASYQRTGDLRAVNDQRGL